MSGSESDPPASTGRTALGGAGWIILAAVVLILIVTVWRLVDSAGERGEPAIGDGRTVESYRFDLSHLNVDPATLVATGIPKDGLPAISFPPILTTEQVDAMGKNRRTKYLVPNDRVIGVAIAGQARCYPIRVLAWHEVVNDTLDG